MQRVINFSGGKSSALMTILTYEPGDIVLFTDTKREHPLTYKFLDDFERIEGITVNRAVYTHKNAPGLEGFDALSKRKYFLPNRTKRICTENLKIATAKQWLRRNGIQRFENYIGFRSDEKSRVDEYDTFKYKKVFPKFPLFEQGINKPMVEQYWLTKPYTLEIPSILGNCDLCFLKGKDNIIKILQVYPELAEKWIKDEELEFPDRRSKGRSFIKGVTYRQLLEIAKTQKSLFDLEEALPAYNCSCTNQ